jgi:heme/copper-type cytochrome/quinol oxidase subunit 3
MSTMATGPASNTSGSGSGLRLVRSAPRPAPRARQKVVPDEVLGVTILVLSELMFFAGLMSAFTIARAAAPEWPPPGQPRLPLEETAINTVALVISGGLAWWAGRRFHRLGPGSARWPLLAAIGLGAFFVLFQGGEWVAMLREGLTLTSSTAGSFFYLIVGVHGLHVLFGLAVLGWSFWAVARGAVDAAKTADRFWAARVFWYFVVGLWPFLYWRVYA